MQQPQQSQLPAHINNEIIEKIRKRCLARGVSGIKTFGRTFRIYDDDGNKTLNVEELQTGLKDYGIGLSDYEAKEVFKLFDRDGSGSIRFQEFIETLRPPLSRARLTLIDAVFDYLSQISRDDNIIDFEDLKDRYSVNEHPKYKSGEWTKRQVVESFINEFEPDTKSRDGKITREEFINYYSGVSANIDKDVYFDFMIRQSWPKVFATAKTPRK